MIDLRTTLLWWVLTRYHVWAIGSAVLAVWGFVEGSTAGDVVGGFLCLVHGIIWWMSHRHRERVRGLIYARVDAAEKQWRDDGRPWMAWVEDRPHNIFALWYAANRLTAAKAALRRPDLWGEWTLNVYCGETDTHFASGCDSWPRWVWEPVKG